MDPITAGIVIGGTGLLGSIFANRQAQRNSENQMEFQRDMSGTAHQREVADLRAAGLNPILSAGGSGASTAVGASAPVENLAKGLSTGMDTALAVRGQNNTLKAQDATISNLIADSDNKRMTNSLIQNQTSASAQDIKQKAMANNI